VGAESNLQIIPLFFVLGAPEIKITDCARRLIAYAVKALFIICRAPCMLSFAKSKKLSSSSRRATV
jgi:hypothetical protein